MPTSKKTAPITTPITESADYKNLLQELQSIIDKGLFTAYKAVDNIKVQTYWQLGERIVREELKHENRAGYGKYLVENLAADMNIKPQRLYEIIKFYKVYPIIRAVHGQLSWYHYLMLINIEDEKKRLFYENKIIQNSWSYRELKKQIKSQLYERTPKREIVEVFINKLPAIDAHEVFKSTYDFNFIELKNKKEKEKELENKLIANIKAFLHELGENFSFLDSQAPIKIDNQTHHIDLVLYHCGIPCKILVDLKIGKISSKDIGQMNKYVAYYKHYKQYEHEQDTIGLIIGKKAGKEEIKFALDKLEQQIFIATYKTKLPSDAQIKKAVKKLK